MVIFSLLVIANLPYIHQVLDVLISPVPEVDVNLTLRLNAKYVTNLGTFLYNVGIFMTLLINYPLKPISSLTLLQMTTGSLTLVLQIISPPTLHTYNELNLIMALLKFKLVVAKCFPSPKPKKFSSLPPLVSLFYIRSFMFPIYLIIYFLFIS